MAEKTIQKENKGEDQGKVKMVPNPFPVEELYIDGIAGVLARGGVFKVECYRVVGFDRDDKSEVRRVTHRLVFPATAMPELAQVVRGVAESQGRVQDERGKEEGEIAKH